MHTTRFLLVTTAALATCLWSNGPGSIALAADAALIGKVTSAEEGAMEGVVVSARKDGSTIRISVVTDAQGRYNFPTSKLEPGSYKISIRAAGYDLDDVGVAEVAAHKTATTDLKLRKTANLAAQLTNAEWMASVPDTPARRGLAGCVTCHTVQRVLDSTYTADDFMTLIPRMMRYGAMSTPARPQLAADRRPTSEPKGEFLRRIAEYFASVNRSGGREQNYALKTAPRPTGRATRVIMTEYELPRSEFAQPHDVVVDADGIAWYSHFGEQFIGRLDNKTGKVTTYRLPEQFDNPRVQIGMIDPRHSHIDGKVWFSEGGTRTFFRLDPETGTFEHIEPFKHVARGTHGAYGIASDQGNNLWFMDFADRNIGKTDKTGATTIYPVPTPQSRPRRGHMTADGRLAFAEFNADRVGIFDIK